MAFRNKELHPKRTRQLALATTLVGVLFGLISLSSLLVVPTLEKLRGVEVAAPDRSVVYVITVDDQDKRGETAVFNERTGEILKRVATEDQPDIAVTADGNRLFTLETKWSDDLKAATHRLSLVDTNDWRLLARTKIQDRILYPGAGPSGLILAPDGSQLFIYSYKVLGDDYADYWLAAVDPITLKILPTHITLPHCDGAWFSTVQRNLVVLCSGSNDLRFIDPNTAKVVATVDVPRSGHVNPLSPEGMAVGFVVAEDQQVIYVVTNDLRIVEISPATRTVIREVTTWRRDPRSVPVGSVEISRNGDQLIVGVLSSPWDSNPSYSLRFFGLPSLTSVALVQLQGRAGFAAAPVGEVYVMPADGRTVNKLTSDLSQTKFFAKFEFPVHRIVVP